MRDLGFKPVTATYAFSDADWELAPKKLPVAVRELVRAGWHIEADGKLFRKPGAFRAELSSRASTGLSFTAASSTATPR